MAEENKVTKKTAPKMLFHKGASLRRFVYKGREYTGSDLSKAQEKFLKKEGVISYAPNEEK